MQSIKWSQHWMLIFVPVALALEHVPGIGAPAIFLVAALGIIPVARLIEHGTENLATYTGDAHLSGLLNATFGNLPELIIAIVALKAGLHAMVASLVGVILFNLLPHWA
jgi:Ca2+:H+ antiporter